MKSYKNVYVTGSIAYDTIMDFPNKFQNYFHPEKLHQINVSFVVDKLEKQLGGTATNIAYNVAKIINNKSPTFAKATAGKQISNVKLLGTVGKDGGEFIKFYKKNKIDISGIIKDKQLYTSAGSVMTDINDNQIWGFYYGAAKTVVKIDFKKVKAKTDFFIISANHQNSFLYFQKEVIKNKIDYLYDPGMALTWITDEDLKEGVMNSTYLIGNDYEIAMITKRLKKTVNELTHLRASFAGVATKAEQGYGGQGGLRIITTLGENGVDYYGSSVGAKRDLPIHIDSYKVKNIIDPTGAGDAWRGGFVAGLLMDYEIRECLKLGNVMASFAIEKYGTVNHKPTIEQINYRMKNIK